MTAVRTDEYTATGHSRPVYTRVQVLGLGLIGATVLGVAVISILADPSAAGETLAFFAPVAIVTLLAAWLAWRFGTWARIVGLVVSLLAGFLLFWTAFGLFAPDSFLDFALGVGVPPGILLGIGGGIAALVSSRRGRVETASTGRERGLVRSVLTVVGVALVASLVVSTVARTSVDPAVAAGATGVEMAGFSFEPEEITVDASDARLVVHNSDPALHDVHVPALGTEAVRVTPGSTVLVDLSGAEPGRYTPYCTLHSDLDIDDPEDAGMAATLVLQ